MQTSHVDDPVCDWMNLSLEVVASLVCFLVLLRSSDVSSKQLTVLLDACSSSGVPAQLAPKVASVLPCQLLAHLPGPPEVLSPSACQAAHCGSSAHIHDRCIAWCIDEDVLTSASQLATKQSVGSFGT